MQTSLPLVELSFSGLGIDVRSPEINNNVNEEQKIDRMLDYSHCPMMRECRVKSDYYRYLKRIPHC